MNEILSFSSYRVHQKPAKASAKSRWWFMAKRFVFNFFACFLVLLACDIEKLYFMTRKKAISERWCDMRAEESKSFAFHRRRLMCLRRKGLRFSTSSRKGKKVFIKVCLYWSVKAFTSLSLSTDNHIVSWACWIAIWDLGILEDVEASKT